MPLSALPIILMAKHPTPGRVKTRLTPKLTTDQAANIHRLFLRHLVWRLSRLNPAELIICFDPPDAQASMAAIFDAPSELTFLPQSPGDLGHRLASAAAAM